MGYTQIYEPKEQLPKCKTVKELIDYLSTLPPETVVTMADPYFNGRYQDYVGYSFSPIQFSDYYPENNVLIMQTDGDEDATPAIEYYTGRRNSDGSVRKQT
jgi:hypothetical protein